MKAGVVLLAGGEATRLPGKLALPLGGMPLLVRTYRAVSPGRELVVACKGTLGDELDALIRAPLVVDRWARRGPLGGLLSAMPFLRSRAVWALAGDAPLVDQTLLEMLERLWRDGDEAVAPVVPDERGDPRIEPLAALYERNAFLRAGYRELRYGEGSVAAVVGRLRARLVPLPTSRALRSVNTPADYEAVRSELLANPPGA